MSSQVASRLREDITAGFLVFLVTLPLCMGIALASGFPAVAGIITSIVGGIIGGYLGGSPLSIKGAPAGLIVICVAAVQELGVEGDPLAGYRRTLAVVVVAGVLQALLGWFKAGKLVEFFPVSVIHGMLSAIGVIVISKQIHVLAGVKPAGKTIPELLGEIPHSLMNANPEVLLVGVLSFVVMLICASPKIQNAIKVPAAVLVLFIGLGANSIFDMEHSHLYRLMGQDFHLGKEFLVSLPASLIKGVTFPDWSMVLAPLFWKHVVLFTLIGTIESCLTVKAIDAVTNGKVQSDANRDLLALGMANIISGFLGGLSMISEVARSKANVDAGARSNTSAILHGAFLLVAVICIPSILEKIPLAALAGLLVFVGYRLASPKEFREMYHRGMFPFIIFCITLALVVATDLLMGVAAGLLLSLAYWAVVGRSVRALFVPTISATEHKDEVMVTLASSAVFSSFVGVRSSVEKHVLNGKRVRLDISASPAIDEEFLERMRAYGKELGRERFILSHLSSDRN